MAQGGGYSLDRLMRWLGGSRQTPVRCSECGFLLTKPPNIERAEWLVATQEERDAEHARYRCMRLVADFDARYIKRQRYCEKFAAWEPGRTAKEHLDVQEIRQAQRNTMIAVVGIGVVSIALGIINLFVG